MPVEHKKCMQHTSDFNTNIPVSPKRGPTEKQTSLYRHCQGRYNFCFIHPYNWHKGRAI